MLLLTMNPLQINISSFAFLFSEIVQYTHARAESLADLEKKSAPRIKALTSISCTA